MGIFDMSLFPTSDAAYASEMATEMAKKAGQYIDYVSMSGIKDPEGIVPAFASMKTKTTTLPSEQGSQYQVFYTDANGNLVPGPIEAGPIPQEVSRPALTPVPEATERKLKKVD